MTAPAVIARAAAPLLAAWAAAVPAAARATVTLEPPPAATLAYQASEPLGSVALATGPWADGALPAATVEGAVTRAVWQVPAGAEGATTLQLLAPLRDQLAAAGFELLLDCDARACGGFDFRRGVEVLPPPAMFLDLGDFRYLSARRGPEAVSLLVSRSDALGFVQAITVTGAAAAPADPATPDAAPPASPPAAPGTLGATLDAQGHAVLDGLRFASGSAASEGGEAALAALAAWLAANPAARVAVVGHTDATGALAANVALSRRRAEAVARRLAAEFGVDPARVEADGVGWLAPVTSNATEAGREANRRVEAVALPR